MVRLLLFFILLSQPVLSVAQNDSLVIKRLYGTSWELVSMEKSVKGKMKKVKNFPVERLTIYENEIRTETSEVGQLCGYFVRNLNEMWIDCAVENQYYYIVQRSSQDVLVLDVFVKGRDGKYFKAYRKNYKRSY